MSIFVSSRKEVLIAGKYKMLRRIGGGSFGDIYLAINIASGEAACTDESIFYYVKNFFIDSTPVLRFTRYIRSWILNPPNEWAVKEYIHQCDTDKWHNAKLSD